MSIFRTASEIQKSFIDAIKGTALAKAVNGDVYRQGQRPINSTKEDILVIYTYGDPAEIEEGVITVHVCVQDIAPHLCNGKRLADLEQYAAEMVHDIALLNAGYKVELSNIIHSIPDDDREQHLIVIRLRYKFYNE